MRNKSNKNECSISMDILINMTVDAWLIAKHLKNEFSQKQIPSKLLIPLTRLEKYLTDIGIEVIDLTNTKYDPGLAVEIISYSCDPSKLGKDTQIKEMIRPIIKFKDQVVRHGEIILGPVAKIKEEK